jgi:hypothetical protein
MAPSLGSVLRRHMPPAIPASAWRRDATPNRGPEGFVRIQPPDSSRIVPNAIDNLARSSRQQISGVNSRQKNRTLNKFEDLRQLRAYGARLSEVDLCKARSVAERVPMYTGRRNPTVLRGTAGNTGREPELARRYSARNAVAGSTSAAWSAGTTHARHAIEVRASVVTANVAASCGGTP